MPEEKPIETMQKPIELEGTDIRGKICELTSEMLDNPDDCGIYPTTKFYDAMEAFIQSTYLQGVKAGKQEAIIEITHFNWEDGAIKLKEKLSPLT